MSRIKKENFQKTDMELLDDLLNFFQTFYNYGEVGKTECFEFYKNFAEYVLRLHAIKSENYTINFNYVDSEVMKLGNFNSYMMQDNDTSYTISLKPCFLKHDSQKNIKAIFENKNCKDTEDYVVFEKESDYKIAMQSLSNFIKPIMTVGHELKHVVQYINENKAMTKDSDDVDNCYNVYDYFNESGSSFNVKNQTLKKEAKKELNILRFASYTELSADKYGYYFVGCLLSDLRTKIEERISMLKSDMNSKNVKELKSLNGLLDYISICSQIASQEHKYRQKITAKYKLQLNELEAKHNEIIQPIEPELQLNLE